MTAPQGGTPSVATKYSPWLVLFTLCLGFFMILLDTTIVNVAIPQMSAHLHAGLSDVLWILNAYILVYAVLLITAGRLGDLYGPKQLFILGLLIFTAASTACGLAKNPDQMIIFRVIQGIGGALLTPQTLSVITMIFPSDKRGAAFGLWGAVAGVATVAGPTLGGWLVTDYSWRWIFFVNVPVGVIALILASVVMPNIQLNRKHSLDLSGVMLSLVSLFLIVYGLIEGQSHDWGKVWGPITIPMIIAAGVLLLGVFLWVQYLERDGEPLVPFSLFRDRNFATMNFVVAAIAFGMLGLFLPLTIFLQNVLGLTALQAGLTTAPMSVISMFIAPLAGRFADRIGGKWILFCGVGLFATGMGILIASSHVDSSRWHLLPGLIVAGFGLGMTFAPLQTIAMRDVAAAPGRRRLRPDQHHPSTGRRDWLGGRRSAAVLAAGPQDAGRRRQRRGADSAAVPRPVHRRARQGGLVRIRGGRRRRRGPVAGRRAGAGQGDPARGVQERVRPWIHQRHASDTGAANRRHGPGRAQRAAGEAAQGRTGSAVSKPPADRGRVAVGRLGRLRCV